MALTKKCSHWRAKTPCGCAWWADVRVDGLRVWRNLGPDQRAAQREYRQLTEAVARGLLPAPAVDDSSYAALAQRWLATMETRLRDSTAHAYRHSLAHSIRYFGRADVARINAAAIAEMEGQLRRGGLSVGYVRNIRALVLQVLAFAVDDDKLAQVPALRRNRAENHHETRFLTPDEVDALAAAIWPEWRSFIEFGYFTGLRPGEMLALEAERDFGPEVCRVRFTRNGSTNLLGPPKTRRSRRDVVLEPEALAAAERAPGWKDGALWPRRASTLRWHWAKAIKRSGIEPCTPHALRHSNVALRIAAGQDLQWIADQMGHATAGFTLAIYGHLMPRRQAPPSLAAAHRRLAAA